VKSSIFTLKREAEFNGRYKTDREKEIPFTTQGMCLPQSSLSEGYDLQIPSRGISVKVSRQPQRLR